MKIREFYGFTRPPFSKDVGAQELFSYSQLEQLSERIAATVEDGSGLLVSGRAGTGKTTAVRAFVSTLSGKHRVIYLGQFQRGSALFARLGQEFGIRTHLHGPKRMVSLVRKVSDESGNGRRLVLIVDEAHLLERDTFEDIRLLTNSEMDRSSPMSLIMIGQRWLRNMLKKEGHEALYQRLRLRYALEGLSEGETKAYILHHLQLAGCTRQLFADAAIRQIFIASEGILREINNICYESILVGAARKAKTIEEEVVNWVVDQRELS